MVTRARLSLVLCCLALLTAPLDRSPLPESPAFAAPVPWASTGAAQLQVLVRLPMHYRFHRGALTLDGAHLDNTPVVVRGRWWTGKGVDLIATVDISDLDRGWHRLRAELLPTAKGKRILASEGAARAGSAEVNFFFDPRPHRVHVRIQDEAGSPRYGRLMVHSEEGDPIGMGDVSDEHADPTGRDRVRFLHAVPPDGLTLLAEPGRYILTGSGGLRDGAEETTIDLDGDRQVLLTVPRVLETPGELTADLHIHTARSSDAFISDTERFRSLVAADVEVAVITEHNRIRDPRPAIEMLGLADSVNLVLGTEFRIGPVGESIGHGNAFPLKPEVKAVVPGSRAPGEVFAAWRTHHQQNPIPGDETPLLIQLNHPRGIQFWPDKAHRRDAHGLFEELQFEPTKPLAYQADERARKHLYSKDKSILSFDAIEVLNRFSAEGWRAVRQDWFALLNRGHQITGTGNSDSHSSQLEAVGFPVNLVRTDPDSVGGVVEAVRRGQVRVSSGPLVDLMVHCGDEIFRTGQSIAAVSGPCRAVVHVQAVDWVPVAEVRLVVNGEVFFREAIGSDGADHHFSVDLPRGRELWVLAEAGWPIGAEGRPEGGLYERLAPGHVPIGFTNPIWLDADGLR